MSDRLPDRSTVALIKGKPVHYRVRRSRRARKMGVQVCRRDGVVITLPQRVALKIIPELLEHWAEWIDAKADQYGVRLGPAVKHYSTGSMLSILGQPHTLHLAALPSGRSRPVFHLGNGRLEIQLAAQDVFAPRPVLEKYLRRLARHDLEERVGLWAERIGLFPKKIIVGERTSRWGSCSQRATLSFCYRLIMAPPAVIDAVVAHEICHLAHMNHGPRFYALLDKACPGHRRSMAWLRDHEDDLLL